MDALLDKCFIGGAWVGSSDGATTAVTNPATDTEIGRVPSLTREDIASAISTAEHAFPSWSAIPALERAQLLYKTAALLRAEADEIAFLVTTEQGKPLREARAEVHYAAAYFQWFAEEARRIYGDIIPADQAGKRIMVLKQPVGVAAAITPWNFPVAMLARKMGAALAAGCTFIAKPAPETPLSALLLGNTCERAGFPAGTVNIVTGDAQTIGELLLDSPVVRKISFTGSTEVGKLLIRGSAETVKKLTLELGGNAPLIVCEDADITKAIDGSVFAKFRNAGQTCICVNRFLVHESLSDTFFEKLQERVRTLVIGDGRRNDVDIGPLISSEAVEKVQRLMADACAKGACLFSSSTEAPEGGKFIRPSILSGITREMDIWSEEIFGPVCAISTFRTDDEAINLANDTQYGLAAYIYSQDLARALSIAERLDFGMVGLNDTAISSVQAPFGGVKQSGYGREGGRQGIEEYLVCKYLSIG